jgi:hypothetical protein
VLLLLLLLLQGKPRLKPPFPAGVGLYGCPTTGEACDLSVQAVHLSLYQSDNMPRLCSDQTFVTSLVDCISLTCITPA